MTWTTEHLDETESTNSWLRQCRTEADRVVWADFQTAGRGSGTNTWESERGKNLLFSVLWHPHTLEASQQFFISMAVALAIAKVVSRYADKVTVKWPNDIYCGDKKICGMLIENSLQGERVKDTIIGIGLNVNQCRFVSNAPNPTSLTLQTRHVFDRKTLLDELLISLGNYLEMADNANMLTHLQEAYHKNLYRRGGVWPFVFADGTRRDCLLQGVDKYGHLQLSWAEKDLYTGCDVTRNASCEFKQVQFVN